MRRVFVAVLMTALFAMSAEAQVRENAPLLLQLPGSTRALGIGDAYPLASTDNDAIFYHPGLIDGARGAGASLAFYERATLATLSAGAEFWGGGMSFGVQSLSYSARNRISGAFALGEAGLGEAGGTSASEMVLSAGYGRVIKGFRIGVVGKYVEMRYAGERDTRLAGDLGIARRVGFITAGFAAQNLGGTPEFGGEEDLNLPMMFTLAASTQTAPLGPFDVGAAASVSRWEDGTVVPHAGVEVAYWPVQGRTFIGRIGVRYVEDSDIQPLTLGAGFVGDRINIDYAVQNFDDARAVHRVGVRLR